MTDTYTLPILETERLQLRAFSSKDAPRIIELAGDKRVAQMTQNIPHPYPAHLAEGFALATRHNMELQRGYVFAMTEKGQDDLIGCIGLTLQREHLNAELGYWLGIPYWGRGYTTEAAKRLIQFGFEELELQRIFANWHTDNPASGRVLEKCGLKPEGVLRQHIMKWGQLKDLAYAGILRSEWETS